jgi:hypothetical protein
MAIDVDPYSYGEVSYAKHLVEKRLLDENAKSPYLITNYEL